MKRTRKINKVTLVSLVVVIIILFIIDGISILQLTDNKLFLKKSVSAILNDESENNEYISNDIEDFTPNIKEINGDYIEVQVDEIKTKNDIQICGYIWLLNGKVKECNTENKYEFVDLEYNTEYKIQVIAVDENAKFKYSKEISQETIDKTYLYNHGKEFSYLTGGFTKSPRSGEIYSSSFNEDNIYINCHGNSGGGGIHTVNKIDLTNYKYLKAYGYVSSLATRDSSALLVSTTTVNYWGSVWYPAGYTSLVGSGPIIGETTITNDITSLTGLQYICAGFNQGHGYIFELWLEK